MKKLLIAICLIAGINSFAQQQNEKELTELSARIFRWEVGNNIDSLENAFHDKFIVVSSDGSSSRKNEYLHRLRNGSFVHNEILVEESSAIVSGNTATVVGKGTFKVTMSGKPVSLKLSYIEVFTRQTASDVWQVLAMKASVLEK